MNATSIFDSAMIEQEKDISGLAGGSDPNTLRLNCTTNTANAKN